MIKKYAFILLLGIQLHALAQIQVEGELHSGIGFQFSEIEVNNQEVSSLAWQNRFGAQVKIPIVKNFSVETGIYGIHSKGGRDMDYFTMKFNSLHLQVPLMIGYNWNKWNFSLGAAFQNERDFEESNIDLNHNARISIISKVNYQYTDRLSFSFFNHWSAENTPDRYAVSFPKNGLLLGVNYRIFKGKDKKENDEE
jgi:hypothetical protein